MRKVMVFGVFDGVHDGHKFFLKEARDSGDYLIAVISRDSIVHLLKGHAPKFSIAERIEKLKKIDWIDEVVMGDAELGVYSQVFKHKPDVIALGYDQTAMKENLEANYAKFDWKPKIAVLNPHEPDKYKSSLLHL